LDPGPSSYKKKNLPGHGLTKVENHCSRVSFDNVVSFTEKAVDLHSVGMIPQHILGVSLITSLKSKSRTAVVTKNSTKTNAVSLTRTK
jgi:hypothetical protein